MGNEVSSSVAPDQGSTSLLTPSGDNALSLSIKHKYDDVFQYLVEHKFTIDHPETGGNCPIHVAVLENNLVALKVLINHGADINARNSGGMTALHLTCLKDQTDLVKVLLANGANPNGSNNNSAVSCNVPTPMRLAADNDHYENVKMLLDYGGNPDLKDIFGFNLLHRIAAVEGRYLNIASLVVEHSHSFRVTDMHGHSALSWAIYTDQCNLAKSIILKLKEKTLELPANEKVSPLVLAIHRTCQSCFENLIENFGYAVFDYGSPTPLEFALIQPLCSVSMMRRGGKNVEKIHHNPSRPLGPYETFYLAKHIISEFPVQLNKSFVDFCLNEAIRYKTAGFAIASLVFSASGHVCSANDDTLRIKQEFLFEFLGKKDNNDLVMKMYSAGFTPNTGNILNIHHDNELKNRPQDLVEELNHLARKPRTLLNLSTLVVRECIKDNVVFYVKQLNPPPRIRELVTLGFQTDDFEFVSN